MTPLPGSSLFLDLRLLVEQLQPLAVPADIQRGGLHRLLLDALSPEDAKDVRESRPGKRAGGRKEG